MCPMIFIKQSVCFLVFCLSSNFLFAQTTSHYNTSELKFGEVKPLESFFEDGNKPFIQILYLFRDPILGSDRDSKKKLANHREGVLSGLDSIFAQDQGKFPGLRVVHFDSPNDAQRKNGKNDPSLEFCESQIVQLKKETQVYINLPTNDLVNAASEVAAAYAFQLENICAHVYEVVFKNGTCNTSRTTYPRLLKALFTDNKLSESWMQYTALERIKYLELKLENQNEQFSELNKNFDEIRKDIDRLSGNFNSLTKRKPLELTFRLGFSSASSEVTPMISDAAIDFGLSTIFENRLGFEIRTTIDTLKVGAKTTYGFQGGLSSTRYRQRLEFADFEFAVSDAAYVPSGFQSLLLRGSNLDERLELSFTSLALGGFVQYPFSENLKLTFALAPTLIFVNNVNSHIDEGQYSIYGITQGFELEVTNVDSLGLFQDLELPNASQGVAYRTLNVGLDTQISLQYNLYRNVSIELNLLRSGRNIAVATDEFDVQRMLTGRDRDTFVKINQPSISGAWFGQIGISIAL
jgi:uncharacterized coiled-coil protein SlyX